MMILDHYAYTGEVNPELLTIPVEVVEFYGNLWGKTKKNETDDTMVFFPTQGLETWQCPGWPVDPTDCPTNDMPTVAGMHAVLEKLLALPDELASVGQKGAWRTLKSRVPPLPVINGSHWACDDCTLGGTGPGSHKLSNGENVELYAVHPYRQATIGRGDAAALKLANAAFDKKLDKSDSGWNQNAMDAALLGRSGDAANFVVARASTAPALGYRFPAFAPHEQDYEPSADHFAVFSNALQYMLVQRVDDAVNDSVLLLPAWPCGWDVKFKVSYPHLILT